MEKVLVIDDEPNIRTLLDTLLRFDGYEVILADNGWDGLRLYRQERPDVIVLDLKMPGIDGITVLKEIRRGDLRQPVIVLTGDSSPKTERQVHALGVTQFIVKAPRCGSYRIRSSTCSKLLPPRGSTNDIILA